LQWKVHPPKECKGLPPGKGKKKPSDKKAIKRSQFKERKKAYIHAKAAYEACMSTSTDSDDGKVTLIMTRTLTGLSQVTHQKIAIFLDLQGARKGDQSHLMQPNFYIDLLETNSKLDKGLLRSSIHINLHHDTRVIPWNDINKSMDLPHVHQQTH
jgi:hypothetical protein